MSEKEDFKLPKLSEISDPALDIKGVRFGEGKYGKYAVVDLAGETEYYRTSSKVLLDQLSDVADYLERNGGVFRTLLEEVTSKSGRKYHKLWSAKGCVLR